MKMFQVNTSFAKLFIRLTNLALINSELQDNLNLKYILSFQKNYAKYRNKIFVLSLNFLTVLHQKNRKNMLLIQIQRNLIIIKA